MKNNGKVLVAIAAIVAVLGWWLYSRRSAQENVIDLVATFPQAEHRSNITPVESAFQVGSVTIDGQTRRTILAKTFSRITYTVTVPPDAWLEVNFAMEPESWDKPGDGAQFRIGVSEGRNYEEILKQYVNPKRGDRRWFSARLDLAAYEGHQVKLIFNTDPGPDSKGTVENDLAVWGEPHLYSKR
jgi:hypothetical protein